MAIFILLCLFLIAEEAKRAIRSKTSSPITDLALRVLYNMAEEDSSISKTYFTRVKSGVLIKSVTIAISNHEQRLR